MSAQHPTVPPGTIPPAEVDIDTELVRRLLRSQHPDLANGDLSIAPEGFDNVTVRCGDELAIRLPRREVAARLIRNEQRWLPLIAPELPVAIPDPIRVGVPDHGYPWPWSIVRWVDGQPAATHPPAVTEAGLLGEFLSKLHTVPVAADAPTNPFRGIPLRDRGHTTQARLKRLATVETGLAVSLRVVDHAIAAAERVPIDTAPTWLHGDLHPRNVVIDDGRIAAVIDWGDMCIGDPATDLASVWMLFDPADHQRVWDVYAPTEATVDRARGWALALGVALLDAGLGNDDLLEASGRRAIERATAGVPG